MVEIIGGKKGSATLLKKSEQTKKSKMPFYTKESIGESVQHAVNNNASIIFWHMGISDVSYLKAEDNVVWKKELKGFRKNFKEGILTVLSHNNKKKVNEFGTWYQLILTPTDMDKCPQSPLPMLAFSELVSGYPYYFKSEKDRNNVFKFITKE
tara:strand:- start:6778 stop:7236 length:459 start_codon:yes stop_codon:yes gene_type:complete